MGSPTDDFRFQTSARCAVTEWKHGKERLCNDFVAQEVPVALVYNGISHAVMMASPANLEEFATGFSFTEGIIKSVDEILDIEVIAQPTGVELEITVSGRCFNNLKHIRRSLAGRTGCGICGRESLQQLAVEIRPVVPFFPEHGAIDRAVVDITAHQPLQMLAGGVHGAAWCDIAGNIQYLFEDVGRHNALDKLIGFQLIKRCGDPCVSPGFVLVSSRASYEMVQKSAIAGFGDLVSLSAATSEAVILAQKTKLNLIGFARPGRHISYNSEF